MATLDGLIQEVGSCGLFQVLLVLFVHSTMACSVWGMLLMVFGGLDPGWQCMDGLGDESVTGNKTSSSEIVSTTPPYSLTNLTNYQCEKFRLCQNISFNPGSSTLVTEWNLVCDDQWVLNTIFTMQMVGVLIGAYICGHFGDCIGRKFSLYGMVALHAVANIAAVFSPSWQVFTAVRFIIGFAVGGILTAMNTLPMEFLGQFWRGVAGSLPTWNVGAVLFSVAVMVLRDWRQVHLLTAAVSALLFLPVFWVPESLRWLAVHGRDRQAEMVARKIAKMNRRPKPSSELLSRVTEAERSRANNSGRYSYVDLLIRGGRRVSKHAVCMGLIWVFMAFVYYGISFGIKSLSGDFYINFLLFSVGEIIGFVFVVPAITLLGRRWGSAAHFIVATLACFAVVPVTLLMGNNSSQQQDEINEEEELLKGKLIMGFALIAKVMVIGAWAAVTVFSGELFPTVVRSLAFGFLNAAARIGGMLGPVLFPQEPELLYIGLVVMGGLTSVCTVLVLALPETKGAALEDTMTGNAQATGLMSPLDSQTESLTGHETTRVFDQSRDYTEHQGENFELSDIAGDENTKPGKDERVRILGRLVIVGDQKDRIRTNGGIVGGLVSDEDWLSREELEAVISKNKET